MITTKITTGGYSLHGKFKKLTFFLIFGFAFIHFGQAQKTISGTVTTSSDGMTLPGVNVVIKGTATGTATDFDGNYSISASDTDILVFSYVGFKETEILVGANTTIDVVLEVSASELDEVVVIGYGSQKKADLTGSVSVVDTDEAKKTLTYDVAKMLQGQAAGVTVQSSGEPGGFVNIKIRGAGSFLNNNPLFVVDGVVLDSPYDFATGDIESIQILKDATSASIYGVNGANGVVIITTKKGKEGKLAINYRSTVGFQAVPESRWYDLTDRVGYQNITSQAELNDGLSIVPGNDPNSEFFIDDVDTDWQDAAFKTGVFENHTLGFSGGSSNMNYNLNLDYLKNSAYFEGPQDYERYAMSLNLGGEKGKFKYGATVNYSQSNKANFNEYLPGTSSIINLIQAIPTMPVYDPNRLGGYGGASNDTQRAITLNVVGFNNLITNENLRNRFVGSVWGEYEIIEGLTYRLNVSGDRLDYHNKFFNPPSDLGWYYITTNDEAALDLSSGYNTRTFVNNILTYNVTLAEKHNIEVMLGNIQERRDTYNHWGRGVGFEPGEIAHLEYADAISGGEYETTETTISNISRLNYDYDDRYLLQLNYRQDKSSKFAPRNDTGNYYSASFGWKIHNEKFITLPDWINTLKLRGGYGELGNNTIGVYDYESVVNPFASYVFGNTLAPGTIVVDVKDPDIKWEDTSSINAAVDMTLFNNRMQFTAEYFKNKSTDLLAEQPLPYSTGAFPAAITTNAATVENRGLEFTVSYGDSNENFSYNISANLGTLKNEVLSIGADDNPITGAASRTEVGRSVGEIYAYETEGLFQSQEDIDNHAFQPNAQPGDVKFRDVNGDGLITDDDRTFQGVTIPKYTFGLNLSAGYKGFDFSCLFTGAGGHKIFNGTYRSIMIENYTNHHTDALNYWTPDNTNTNIPRPTISNPNANDRDSDRFVQDGDYVKLQNIEIGYTIPTDFIKFIDKARVYVNGQNVFFISDADVYDPDILNDGLFSRGYYFGSFPNPRTLAFGIEVNF